MGTITSFPITTSTIPELDEYGSVNNATKATDLIEEAKNIGTVAAPIWVSVKSSIDEFKTRHGLSGQPRFFEKYDKYEIVFSSETESKEDYGTFVPFEITPEMHGYYLQLHYVFGDGKTRESILWGNNLAIDLQFTGTFPDGFCIRIQPMTLGGSKCNISDFFLTSGKAYDFVYSLDDDHWAIDELQNLCHPVVTYLPNYQGNSDYIYLTNTNHTYVYKYGNWSSPAKKCKLLPTNLWRGRQIRVYLDKDAPNATEFGQFFYPTPYAIATGTNDYECMFVPSFLEYREGTVIWVQIPSNSSGLVTIDAGATDVLQAGAKKVYVDAIQGTSGDFLKDIIYEFVWDSTLDSANGGWQFTKIIDQPDLIEGENVWRFPYGVSGIKTGSYVVFESDGFGSIMVADMNIII